MRDRREGRARHARDTSCHSRLRGRQATGQAGHRVWGPIFLCEPFSQERPDIIVLWVRY
ncbi:hypothetical protein [Streptomyces sp. NPDC093111]|uniref:hypothetical protein n=1 Tax=Streptomyces sp. NPDC093111 TaxID=3154978 RepID=UPI00343D9F67